ncbi:MAG: Asp-tRNA(Asn)/Glu-tRNA(Gln) amidotransferase subunit GatA [Candidatus Pacebacteria bacterium]|nr:Asp-tRNA(Asn)/Glu-tRNA(Gln) amidotransferase subunit GatA [Candidatus Paceibacterota bacterium]
MLNKLTLAETIRDLKNKKFSHRELYQDLNQAISQQNKDLNVYLTLDEQALDKAEKLLDTPLAGIPVAVKDNFCTRDFRTTASSKVLENFVPQFESTVTKKIKQAGGVILGKTNMDAWAHGSSTETSDFGRTLNPRNTDHLPGGSSGGSAAAIAADLTITAIGSETAGSIRQPSAWCGTVGLKPTYGRVSRYGVASMASSTDSPGPITKTVEDAAIMFNLIAGHDPLDGTSSAQTPPDLTQSLNTSIKGLKIGVIYQDIAGIEFANEKLMEQLKVLDKLGATIEQAQAMDPRYAIGVYTVVQRGEVSSNLARYSGVRYKNDRSFFGAEAKRRQMLGTYTLSKGYAEKYYELAQKVRTLYINDLNNLFKKYDLLVAPTSPGFAKKIGVTEGQAMFGELEDMLVEASSLAGLPGLNVPYYHDEKTNLFLGMNIMAPMWREDLLIQVGDAFEKNTAWNTWRNQS